MERLGCGQETRCRWRGGRRRAAPQFDEWGDEVELEEEAEGEEEDEEEEDDEDDEDDVSVDEMASD